MGLPWIFGVPLDQIWTLFEIFSSFEGSESLADNHVGGLITNKGRAALSQPNCLDSSQTILYQFFPLLLMHCILQGR